MCCLVSAGLNVVVCCLVSAGHSVVVCCLVSTGHSVVVCCLVSAGHSVVVYCLVSAGHSVVVCSSCSPFPHIQLSCWRSGMVAISRAADLGSIPAFAMSLFPSQVIPVT